VLILSALVVAEVVIVLEVETQAVRVVELLEEFLEEAEFQDRGIRDKLEPLDPMVVAVVVLVVLVDQVPEVTVAALVA
jgi:hypothetical protein